jgi:xylulokinase
MGVAVESVRASGGGGQSPFWRQILADVFGKRVVALETQEGSAYGAALLAMTGTGEYASVPEACAAAIKAVDTVEPRGHESQAYRRGYQVYKALYPSLRPLYGLIEGLR